MLKLPPPHLSSSFQVMTSSGEYHLILFVCMAVTDGWVNAISVTLNESTVLLGMTQTLSQTTHVIWLCCCHLKKTLKYVNKRIPHCHQFKSYLKAEFAASAHCQGRGHFVTGPLCHLPDRPLPSLGPGCWHRGALVPKSTLLVVDYIHQCCSGIRFHQYTDNHHGGGSSGLCGAVL